MQAQRHRLEAEDSWRSFLQANLDSDQEEEVVGATTNALRRRLKKDHKGHVDADNDDDYSNNDVDENKIDDLLLYEESREEAFLLHLKETTESSKLKSSKSHTKRMKKLYADPGILPDTVHGFMIDAGSTGSRIHLYEWNPRVLDTTKDVEDAVAGRKLSYPTSQSRWSDRLRPGIASFASLPDNELMDGISEYLAPLLEFAKVVLREKKDNFGAFPIFLRATAGMRVLSNADRFRVLESVRTILHNKTYCPFYFVDEFARVLSGEEEAIFGWSGTNFIMGNLLEDSQGAGTVVSPRLTYGALDMGGASTQISYYEPHEDVMSGLFKLQIGQGKHWNLFAHSFLFFGINEARGRYQAYLLAGSDDTSRLMTGVHDPCLPAGTRQEVRLNIHIDDEGKETWEPGSGVSENGFYEGVLKNDQGGNKEGAMNDFEACMNRTKALLHLENNEWCNFAHRGDCSFNGVAMPELPKQSEHFGEFLAFSNYFHVWDFLGLPKRASLQELYDSTQTICTMGKDELFDFNKKNAGVPDEDVEDFCFRSSYVFNVLKNGYGFGMDEHITATDVINGQKVGWPLGAMLYEINTFPWEYRDDKKSKSKDSFSVSPYDRIGSSGNHQTASMFLISVLLGIVFSVLAIFFVRRRNFNRLQYSLIK